MNGYGELGLGDTTDRSTPEQLASPTNVVQVAGGAGGNGESHTVFVDASGAVRAPLLLPCERLLARPAACPLRCACCAGAKRHGLAAAVRLIRLAHLRAHERLLLLSCACVRSQAWATGENSPGQLGLGDTTSRDTPEQLSSPTNIVHVAGGGSHTVFVDGSGAVRIHC